MNTMKLFRTNVNIVGFFIEDLSAENTYKMISTF